MKPSCGTLRWAKHLNYPIYTPKVARTHTHAHGLPFVQGPIDVELIQSDSIVALIRNRKGTYLYVPPHC